MGFHWYVDVSVTVEDVSMFVFVVGCERALWLLPVVLLLLPVVVCWWRFALFFLNEEDDICLKVLVSFWVVTLVLLVLGFFRFILEEEEEEDTVSLCSFGVWEYEWLLWWIVVGWLVWVGGGISFAGLTSHTTNVVLISGLSVSRQRHQTDGESRYDKQWGWRRCIGSWMEDGTLLCRCDCRTFIINHNYY